MKVTRNFDIKERTGRWEGATFMPEPGRAAHIYIFAFHPGLDDEADHRDAGQWEFYPVRAADLPPTQTIGLNAVRELAPASTFVDLKGDVASICRI